MIAQADGAEYTSGTPGYSYVAETIDGETDVQLANARLIAAAPELLLALHHIVKMNPELPMGMIEAAESAIAKATGEEL